MKTYLKRFIKLSLAEKLCVIAALPFIALLFIAMVPVVIIIAGTEKLFDIIEGLD